MTKQKIKNSEKKIGAIYYINHAQWEHITSYCAGHTEDETEWGGNFTLIPPP